MYGYRCGVMDLKFLTRLKIIISPNQAIYPKPNHESWLEKPAANIKHTLQARDLAHFSRAWLGLFK